MADKVKCSRFPAAAAAATRSCFATQLLLLLMLVLFSYVVTDSSEVVSGRWSSRVSPPGFQVRLSQTGLNYGASVAVQVLAGRVLQVTIPDQRGTYRSPIGKIRYEATNMRITNFVKPASTVAVNVGSGITWQLTNAGVTLTGRWRYKYLFIRDSGWFEGQVSGASVAISVTLGRDPTGRPTISSTGCSCSIASLKIRFHGGASWLYNLFASKIEKPVRNDLQTQICVAARRAIDVDARAQLATFPVQIPVGHLYEFDYRQVAPPAFQSGYMDSFHKGEFFFKTDSTEAPYQAAPFPASTTDRMVTLWASDYILDTVGYVLYKHNILKYNLTKNELPADEKGFLNTTCTQLYCFGNIIPQAAKTYPNASVELESSATSSPDASISTKGIRGNFAGLIIYRARLSNGSLVPLFKTKVSVLVSVAVTLNNTILRGNVTNLTPTITVIDSQIGPISSLILTTIFNVAAKALIIPKLNEIGHRGLPLPNIKDVQFTDTRLETADHCVLVTTDVRYSPK